MFNSFRDTLGFLSLLPVGRKVYLEPKDFGRFPAFYPAVGLVFGLILYGLHLALAPFLPAGALAITLATALIALNRGFHLDGLADAADALFSHKPRAEKLIIMKDSRQGTFGVLAIVLDIMWKVAFLAPVAQAAPLALVFWPMWGRLAASVVAVRCDYAREEGGLGRYMVEGCGPRELAEAAAFGLALSLFGGPHFVAAAAAALALGFLLARVWQKTLGGITGDLLGATIEICETFTLFLIYMLEV